MADAPEYKSTLNLPRTPFPMKANLAQREPETLAHWEREDLYAQIQRARADAPPYVLHDGPPYANGHIHLGHVLNKILKDMIVKYRTMTGRRAPYVPGWDCHGLPIEHNVSQELRARKETATPLELRRRCRSYAERFVEVQREEFKRLGIFGDWTRPYITMDHLYEGDIVRELARLVDAGTVYKGTKPVHWCPACRTALAEAEVEYEEHTSPSIYVKFRLNDAPADLPEAAGASIVIWTTTPWTLPANRAIALHPEYEYVVVEARGERLILAKGLVDRAMAEMGIEDWRVLATFRADRLERRTARHPFYDLDSLVILGDHVTLEAGTGAVHTAPGHGQEDFVVGQRYDLEVANPVADDGTFYPDTPLFGGQSVWDANPLVCAALEERGALLKESKLTHSYPHCWRCKSPIIFRATPQWFIAMDPAIRPRALQAIREEVEWIPAWGRDRILGMMEDRPDWCISRQRAWGVPIVAFACEDCRASLMDGDVMRHVAEIFDRESADAWYARPAAELLPEGTRCGSCGSERLVQEPNILDVWFDSGVSFAAVCERNPALTTPADLYLEGSDQHRGWFNSSLLASVGTRGHAPFRAVLTHGFVVDAKGRKMSKSLGNVIPPDKILKKYGAEILRLWVAAEDYRNDIRISDEILQRLAEAYRRIRNTMRFLLGNLDGFDPVRDAVALEDMEELDRWALMRLEQLARRLARAYERAEFHHIYHGLNNFCAVDLSARYLDIVKDRLYCEAPGSRERRSAQTAIYTIGDALTRLMAPVLAFLAEEVWAELPGERAPSVHMALLPAPVDARLDANLEAQWSALFELRETVNAELEKRRAAKSIGHSLDARVAIRAPEGLYRLLESFRPQALADFFIVSQCEATVAGDLAIEVAEAAGEKCARCWKYHPETGADAAHPGTCPRCAAVLRAIEGA